MKLQFEQGLEHQLGAIEAIVASFSDAPDSNGRACAGPSGMAMVPNTLAPTPTLDMAVEMETGTGKTYAVVRAALELSRERGYRKFIVVVPTVAIREGVLKTLDVTKEHFAALYPAQRYTAFGQAGDVGRVARWVRSDGIEFMVCTVDAFNKDTNLLRQPTDRFGGAAPLDAIAGCRPIVLLDEPHRFRSPLRQRSLESLRPLAVIRFGATVGPHPNKVYLLSPRAAHERRLVKTVVVHAPPEGLDARARSVAQIEAAVAGHLERQRALAPRGIKVLTLFFLARVADYAEPDGWVRLAFFEAYHRLSSGHPRFGGWGPEEVSAAYFAMRRSGVAVDSKTGRSLTDAQAYTLIMKDKERLLSLENPVGFVFSHSALREGWDNPNVFGVCTLGRSNSAIRKRQEIGRGMRLCVDQSGRRVADPSVNRLVVYANESYADYAAALQGELEAEFDAPSRPPAPVPEGATAARPDVAMRHDPVRFSAEELLEAALACCSGPADLPGPPEVSAVLAFLLRGAVRRPLRSDTVAAFIERIGNARDGGWPCAASVAQALCQGCDVVLKRPEPDAAAMRPPEAESEQARGPTATTDAPES